MTTLNFKKLGDHQPQNDRARSVLRLHDGKQERIGTLYLNANEFDKNDNIFEKLSPDEIKEVNSFITNYNNQRRLMAHFNNKSLNTYSYHINDDLLALYNAIEATTEQSKPLTLLIQQSIENAIDKAAQSDDNVKSLCQQYGYNYQIQKTVFKPTFEDRKKIIEIFLSLDDDKERLMQNLNDYLLDCFNTKKQFTVDQVYNMINPELDFFPKAYFMAAVIDVIQSYGINPTSNCDIQTIFHYWYQARLLHLTEPKATKLFTKLFELDEDCINLLQDSLRELLTRDISKQYVGLEKLK